MRFYEMSFLSGFQCSPHRFVGALGALLISCSLLELSQLDENDKLVAAAATAISCTNAPGSVFPIELHLQHVNLTCIIQQLNLTWFIRSCMISAYPGLRWPHWTWLLVRLRWSAFKKQLTERWRSCWPAKRANSWVGKVGYVTRWCSPLFPHLIKFIEIIWFYPSGTPGSLVHPSTIYLNLHILCWPTWTMTTFQLSSGTCSP